MRSTYTLEEYLYLFVIVIKYNIKFTILIFVGVQFI